MGRAQREGSLKSYSFDLFRLDPADRRLTRDGAPVEVSARYFDALALLVAERGRLVSKDRFMGEVWRGIPVTDEALTQCIRTLRKQLGDDAARPRFIETVPKHGYRFVAPVEVLGRPLRHRARRASRGAKRSCWPALERWEAASPASSAALSTGSQEHRSRSSPAWARFRCSWCSCA